MRIKHRVIMALGIGDDDDLDQSEHRERFKYFRQALEPPKDPSEPVFSRDFQNLTWCGHRFEFTRTQAACMKVLYEAWREGTGSLDQEFILSEAGSRSKRLLDIFRGHRAWGVIIVASRRRGRYKLVPPWETLGSNSSHMLGDN